MWPGRAESNWGASLQSVTAANFWGGWGGGGGVDQAPLFPGGRHPLGPDYLGHWGWGIRRGQKDGSVEYPVVDDERLEAIRLSTSG